MKKSMLVLKILFTLTKTCTVNAITFLYYTSNPMQYCSTVADTLFDITSQSQLLPKYLLVHAGRDVNGTPASV